MFFFVLISCTLPSVCGAKYFPNFVVIISDDQDNFFNGMEPMKKTRSLLSELGVTYKNAYTTTPVCCPSRSSILSGLYLHNHHVVNNSIDGGCSSKAWQSTHEPLTFAAKLQRIGYSTFYAGKYLNQYGGKNAGGVSHIPPGWDQWIGLIGNSKYYDYSISLNGKKQYYKRCYLTRLLRYHSKRFIRNTDRERPFLMVIGLPAPHAPFTPEQKYDGYYSNEKIPRTIQFNTNRNMDKHWLARMKPSPLSNDTIKYLDGLFGKRWETLLSVDDSVESIVEQLTEEDLIDETYILYTSDNGYHFGQFSMPNDKRQPYEFDVRVPLIIRGPKIPRNVTISYPVLLLDIAATILKLSGFDTNHLDGKPFLPLELISTDAMRIFLIEYHGEKREKPEDECWPQDENLYGCNKAADCKCQDSRNNTYTCLKIMDPTTDFIYCKFNDDEQFEEAYNLKLDPFQMSNIAYNLSMDCKRLLNDLMHRMESCRGSGCSSYGTNKSFNLFLNCHI